MRRETAAELRESRDALRKESHALSTALRAVLSSPPKIDHVETFATDAHYYTLSLCIGTACHGGVVLLQAIDRDTEGLTVQAEFLDDYMARTRGIFGEERIAIDRLYAARSRLFQNGASDADQAR